MTIFKLILAGILLFISVKIAGVASAAKEEARRNIDDYRTWKWDSADGFHHRYRREMLDKYGKAYIKQSMILLLSIAAMFASIHYAFYVLTK